MKPTQSSTARPARSARGASLLEVLLAVALGVSMTAAIVQLFIVNSRSQATLAGQARLQESARQALDFLTRSARGAGYFGCAAAGNVASGLNGDLRQLAELDATVALEAFDGANANAQGRLPLRGVGSGAAFRSRNRINAARLRAGSDIAVFRRADAGSPLAAPFAAHGQPIVVVDADRRFDGDDFVLLSACGHAGVFRVSSTSRNSGQTTLARTAGSGPFGNRAGGSLLAAGAIGSGYGDAGGARGAMAALLLTEFYFVARSRAANNRGQPVWSLWRKTSVAGAAELVQGVEDLQLLIGVDTTPGDGDDAPTRYVGANGLGPNDVARAVRIAVTASSVDAVTAEDRVLRRTFSRTVALRNR